MEFNWLDILLILLIGINVWLGWQRGFILSILDLVRWISSWIAALVLYKYVSGWLGAITDWTEVWRAPIAFLIVLLVVSAVIHALGRRLLKRIPRDYHEHRANHAAGTLPGLVNGLIIAALISALMFSAPLWICLLSIPLLGEEVGWRRWVAGRSIQNET